MGDTTTAPYYDVSHECLLFSIYIVKTPVLSDDTQHLNKWYKKVWELYNIEIVQDKTKMDSLFYKSLVKYSFFLMLFLYF